MLYTNSAIVITPATGTTGTPSTLIQPPPVLPLEDALRARLLSVLRDPAERLIVLLAGVHALRPSDIRALALDDVNPTAATLVAGGRARPLDRLTAGHRSRTARRPAAGRSPFQRQ
jgi:hypothetical protein